MKIKIKELRTVCFGLVASLGYGQQVIDNVGIGLGGPNYGARIDVSSLKGWNGAWSRGFQIGENSDPNNLNLIMFGGKGTTSINSAPTLDYGFIGKDWNKAYMTFLPNGNVGVGTVLPITKLDVYGDISLNFQHGASPIFRAAFQSPNAGAIDFGDGSGWKFYIRRRNDNMKLVTFLDNGNVGVGTDNPSEKMEVNGGYIRITNSGKEGPALSLYNPEKTEAGAVWRMYNMTGPYGNSLQFWNYPNNFSNSNQRLVLHDNGDMSLKGNITLGKNLYASDLVSGGTNSWIFHTPDDGRNTLHIAPYSENNWKWDKGMVIKADGNAALQGKLEAKEIKVTTTPTADFVFADDYNLPKLEEVEKHVKEKRHLPEIASAKEMEKEGVNVGAFQIKLLQKIEELTLYVIQQKKQLEIQNKRIEELEKKNRK
ncbi:hypothetical protein [Flavobacterium columnare]|uniref:hypothetical protein n=1 Tax=Flavobacterium columnare TaxID=996 RepID=UPI001CE088D6|nr:hypothetical protein [Flavobacterium columnare]AUX18044.1 hypothetical protein AQ623_07030 [Flavobacterium columnare]